jgi:hypothetical protein
MFRVVASLVLQNPGTYETQANVVTSYLAFLRHRVPLFGAIIFRSLVGNGSVLDVYCYWYQAAIFVVLIRIKHNQGLDTSSRLEIAAYPETSPLALRW